MPDRFDRRLRAFGALAGDALDAMKVASFVLVFLVLCALVTINAGSGRRALATGTSILIVVGGLLLMAALFAWLVTRPAL